jgi:arylsulfatase A-like enzyme
MDWVPTILAAAGASQAPTYQTDGMDLLPMLTGAAAEVPRKLFWRFKASAQRAARDGDYKFLKILDNTFLFNVVEDPMERANLKQRLPAIYDRLVDDWHAWNATMLPETDESYTIGISGDQQADRPGATKPSGKADNPPPKKPR